MIEEKKKQIAANPGDFTHFTGNRADDILAFKRQQ